MSSVNDIKNELVKMGLATQTPGLMGEERLIELKSRLEIAQGKTRLALGVSIDLLGGDGSSNAGGRGKGRGNGSLTPKSTNRAVPPPNIADLTVSEIRSRLQGLGENTNTPGLNGEERRAELMKRLVAAICNSDDVGGGDEDSDDDDDGEVAEPLLNGKKIPPRPTSREPMYGTAQSQAQKQAQKRSIVSSGNTPPPKYVPAPPPHAPPPHVIIKQSTKGGSPSDDNDEGNNEQEAISEEEEEEDFVPASQGEINELKKAITRMSNKRAMFIAARLSGSGQDKDLRECEKRVSQADAELARVSVQKQRSKLLGAEKASSLIVDGGTSMPISRLQSELEQLRASSKEDIKNLRQRIKEEGDEHEEYGMLAQKNLEKKLAEAVASKGRTHRNILNIKNRGELKKTTTPNVATNFTALRAKPNSADSTETGLSSRPSSQSKKTSTNKNESSKGKSKNKDRFDARVNRMEADSEKAMDGLDTLIAEMELEDALKANHTTGTIDEGIDMLPPSMQIKSGSGASAKHSAGSSTVAVNPVVADVSLNDANNDSEEAWEEEEEHENDHEDDDDDDDDMVPPNPGSDSPLRITTSNSNNGSLSARRVAPPPNTPPKSATITHLGASLHPSSTTIPLPVSIAGASVVRDFGAVPVLRTGSAFDNVDDEYDNEIGNPVRTRDCSGDGELPPSFDGTDEENGAVNDRPDSAATDVTASPTEKFTNKLANQPFVQRTSSRSTTTTSAHTSTLHRDISEEEEDEELASLLRKYPTQEGKGNSPRGTGKSSNADDVAEDEEEESEDEGVVHQRLLQEKKRQQYKLQAKAAHKSEQEQHPNTNVYSSLSSHKGPLSTNTIIKAAASDGAADAPKKSLSSLSMLSVMSVSQNNDDDDDDEDEVYRSISASKSASALGPPARNKTLPIVAAATTISNGNNTNITSPNSNSSKVPIGIALPVIPQVPSIIRTSPISKPTIHTGRSRVDDENNYDNENNDDVDADVEEQDENEIADAKEIRTQITALRKHAKVLERLGDLDQTDKMYRRCLDLDPLHIHTLMAYAEFLHQKRGEVGLAESYYVRAIQVCLPAYYKEKVGNKIEDKDNNFGQVVGNLSPTKQAALKVNAPTKAPLGMNPPLPSHDGSSDSPMIRMLHVVRLLNKYANFLRNGKGDIDGAVNAYRKAIELYPKDSISLANLARFLAEEGDKQSSQEALDLFARAMRANPNNSLHALWYARHLKKNNQLGQADLMYQVALANSIGHVKLEPAAICNYATFRYRQRKDIINAQEMFKNGLEKFPQHKGIYKNYAMLLKDHPDMDPNSSDILKILSPKKKSKNNENARGREKENNNVSASDIAVRNWNAATGVVASASAAEKEVAIVAAVNQKIGISGNLTPPHISTKKVVARVHSRLLLSTNANPDVPVHGQYNDLASAIASDAETPSHLKEDYTASLENLHKSNIIPWTTEEEKKNNEQILAAREQARIRELKENDLAELSNQFNSFFNNTNSNTVSSSSSSSSKLDIVGKEETFSSDSDDEDDIDVRRYVPINRQASSIAAAASAAGQGRSPIRDVEIMLDNEAGIYQDSDEDEEGSDDNEK